MEVEVLEYYKQLQRILNTDLANSPEAVGVVNHVTFTVIKTNSGGSGLLNWLVPNGRNVQTEGNIREYMSLVGEYKMTTAITPQANAFLKGFHDVVPIDLLVAAGMGQWPDSKCCLMIKSSSYSSLDYQRSTWLI